MEDFLKYLASLLFLLAMLGTVHAQQLNPGAGVSGGSFGGGPIIVQSINNTYLYADQYPGLSLDAKLTAAETACPPEGCTIDASAMSGPQVWNNTLVINKPTKLLLNGQISYTGPPLANGLIEVADEAGSGADISCAHGVGINPVWPPIPNMPPASGGPITLNPANLLQVWQCYILTNPTGPLATVPIASISVTFTSPPVAVATTVGAPPFTVGQAVRISGVTPNTFNDYVIVTAVTANNFSFIPHPPMPTTGGPGVASAYMPVISVTYSDSNVNIHDLNFVANNNTGSVIRENAGNRLGLGIVNNHYNHNQFLNTDGIGNQGYAIEISGQFNLGENTNQKEIAWNNIMGLAGCYFVDQSQIVQTVLVGNSCGFTTNAPAFKLDCYQCINTQNTEYRNNIFYGGLGPANHPVFEIDSGYNVNIENNDFELPNILQNAAVDTIWIHQMQGKVDLNTFLSTPNVNAPRYSVNVDDTSAYGHLVIDGNHSSGGETTFFNDPVNQAPPAVGGFQGYLYYGNNEDFNRAPGPGTQLEPSLIQGTGSGSGVTYTTTSTTLVPVDPARLVWDFWMPSGYIATINGAADVSGTTGGSAVCLGIIDLVTNSILIEKAQSVAGGGIVALPVQAIVPPQQAGNHLQVALAFAACGGAGTAAVTNLINPTTDLRPVMSVQLVPAWGGTN